MASQARLKFTQIVSRASLLSAQAAKLRRKKDIATKTVLLHAALATQVAAWDVYIKALATEYFAVTTDNTNIRFMAIHALCQQAMERAKEKLNTPNSDNSREFLIRHTDFDPWPFWTGIKFGATSFTSTLLVRERLNEIFRLRHSFAHGFAMPVYVWNTHTSGTAHLSCAIIKCTGDFFTSICRNTDVAMATHIHTQHSIQKPW